MAFLLLLVLQRSFAALSFSLGWFSRHLKAQPLLIVYRGKILWDAAKKEQLGELEILGGIRNSGTAALEDVLAMVLEPDGTFSVLPLSASKPRTLPTALRDVRGVPEFENEPDKASSETHHGEYPAQTPVSESPHVLACRKAVQNTGSLLR